MKDCNVLVCIDATGRIDEAVLLSPSGLPAEELGKAVRELAQSGKRMFVIPGQVTMGDNICNYARNSAECSVADASALAVVMDVTLALAIRLLPADAPLRSIFMSQALAALEAWKQSRRVNTWAADGDEPMFASALRCYGARCQDTWVDDGARVAGAVPATTESETGKDGVSDGEEKTSTRGE